MAKCKITLSGEFEFNQRSFASSLSLDEYQTLLQEDIQKALEEVDIVVSDPSSQIKVEVVESSLTTEEEDEGEEEEEEEGEGENA